MLKLVWSRFAITIPEQTAVPKSLRGWKENIEQIYISWIYTFADPSLNGSAAVTCAVVTYPLNQLTFVRNWLLNLSISFEICMLAHFIKKIVWSGPTTITIIACYKNTKMLHLYLHSNTACWSACSKTTLHKPHKINHLNSPAWLDRWVAINIKNNDKQSHLITEMMKVKLNVYSWSFNKYTIKLQAIGHRMFLNLLLNSLRKVLIVYQL